MSTEETSQHLTATIVASYVRQNKVEANQLSDLIARVHHTLGQLGQPVQVEEVLMPAVSARRSVHHDYVVCMNCGYRGKTLRRHIRVQHGLSPDEYLRRWGLKAAHPLTAPAYSEQRSAMARQIGLGRKPSIETAVPQVAEAPMPGAAEPETQSAPKRKPRTRRATKAPEVTSEAVAAPTTTRRGRPRSRAGVASQP